jgi:type II restriction/modification system DNA methylase subunit YeeA
VTPEAFIAKWKAAELSERAAAHQHFVDLCRLLNEPTPAEADPKGEWYAFERGATKTTGGKGWADVWKRGHFGWEYKARGKDLTAAFAQLQQYAIALENPPLLVVCDLARFRIHTNWNNSVSVAHEFALEDLRDPTVRQKLKAVLSDPEQLRPGKTRQALTEEAAAEFARLAQSLRARGHYPEAVAHFVNRLVFCMFAEDVGLLPNKLFAKMLASARPRPKQFEQMARQLFRAMGSQNGMVGFDSVEWFNGGLFDDDAAFALNKEEIEVAARAAELDWAEIDPTIFGTLFERGLDPDKRSQLGAHYTDRDKIDLIVEPVIIRPWLAEWQIAKNEVAEALNRAKSAKSAAARTIAHNAALSRYRAFLDRLRAFTVLDPACGSGNFLYVALRALKDLESRVMIEAEAFGIHREFPQIGPAAVKGIEINAYAAELARVTVWVGEIQWMRRNGFDVSREPILKPLETIVPRRTAQHRLDGGKVARRRCNHREPAVPWWKAFAALSRRRLR